MYLHRQTHLFVSQEIGSLLDDTVESGNFWKVSEKNKSTLWV